MHLLTNEIDAEHVRRESEDGTDYLVAPVVLVRSMWLNGPPEQPDVYLPQQEVEASVSRWAGIPGPIDHPEHDGKPISVHDERAAVPVVSEIRTPESTESNGKTAVAGELWVDVDAATDAGQSGQRVVTRLENGDAIEVSSGYAPSQIVQGQFDGEFRDRAAINIQPDHVAILPNDKGRCSLADGCGAGAPVAPVANQIYVQTIADDGPDGPEDDGLAANKTVAGVTFNGTAMGSLDESAISNDDFASHYLFDGETKTESSYPVVDAAGDLRRGNVESAFQLGARGGVSRSALHSKLALLNDEFDDLPIDPAALETNALRRAYQALRDALDVSPSDEPAESGSGPAAADSTHMGEKTQDLVENHDFDAANLPDEDTACFDRIYEAVTNDDGSGSDDSTDEQPGDGGQTDVEALVDELEDRFVTTDDLGDAVADAIAANRDERRKADLIDEIVANTDRERDDLEALDVDALDVLADELPAEQSANFAAQRGSAPSSGGSDSMPSLSARERAAELGGDD